MRASKLAIIVALLFCAVLVFWWCGLNEYRYMISTVQSLRQDMAKMKAYVQETERVLAAVKSLELQVQASRSLADEEIAQSMRYYGNDRIERLERLLEADITNRCNSSPPGIVGRLPASSGEHTNSGVVKGEQN